MLKKMIPRYTPLIFILMIIISYSTAYATIPPDPTVNPPAPQTPGVVVEAQPNPEVENFNQVNNSIGAQLRGTLGVDGLNQVDLLTKDIINLLNTSTDISILRLELTNVTLIIPDYVRAYERIRSEILLSNLDNLAQAISKNTQRLASANEVINYTQNLVKHLEPMRKLVPLQEKRMDQTVRAIIDYAYTTASTQNIGFTVIEDNNRLFALNKVRAQDHIINVNQYHTTLNGVMSSYFGTTNVHTLSKKLSYKLDFPLDSSGFKADISSDLGTVLHQYNFDYVSLAINGTTVDLPVNLVDDAKNFQLLMNFLDTPPSTGLEPTSLNFSQGQITSIKAFLNNNPITTLDSPVMISFDLKRFRFSDSKTTNQLSIYRFNTVLSKWVNVGGQYSSFKETISIFRDNLSQYTVLKSNKSFSDITNVNAKDNINKLLNKGVLKNTPTFNPTANITREEFVGWIAKAYGLENKPLKALPFKDVATSSPYYNAINAVYSQGIIGGKTATAFNPKGTITKAEMAKILSTTLQKFEEKKNNDSLAQKLAASAKNLPSWSVGGISLMVELGLYTSSDVNTPNALVTKAEAASILGRIYD